VLEYHITKGKLYFSGFSQVHNKNITTLQGMNVTASYNGTLAAIAPVTVPIPVNGTLNGTLTNSTAPFVPLTNTTTFLENQFNATLTLITPSGNATIVQKDIIANDAILHFIDRVMVPPGLNVTCV
jgi:uncharacterized surface protein with fasciclin (FAS1) repeats